MAKSKKTVEPYKDVKELNWEETGVSSQGQGASELPAAGCQFPAERICDALRDRLDRVDPEITKDNPVWKWALCDDHCSFVFRDGRKVTVNF